MIVRPSSPGTDLEKRIQAKAVYPELIQKHKRGKRCREGHHDSCRYLGLDPGRELRETHGGLTTERPQPVRWAFHTHKEVLLPKEAWPAFQACPGLSQIQHRKSSGLGSPSVPSWMVGHTLSQHPTCHTLGRAGPRAQAQVLAVWGYRALKWSGSRRRGGDASPVSEVRKVKLRGEVICSVSYGGKWPGPGHSNPSLSDAKAQANHRAARSSVHGAATGVQTRGSGSTVGDQPVQ